MPRVVSAAIAAIALVLLVGALAFAQGSPLAGLAQPIVINIEQAVPVDVTLALPQADGTVVTATAPITVGVALQIKLDSTQVVAVTKPETTTNATVSADAMANQVDSLGLPWRLAESTDPLIEIASWEGYQNQDDKFAVVGRLKNLDQKRKFSLAEITIRFFDADGNMIDVSDGSASGHWVEPGEYTNFEFDTYTDLADVASYTVEIFGSDWQE